MVRAACFCWISYRGRLSWPPFVGNPQCYTALHQERSMDFDAVPDPAQLCAIVLAPVLLALILWQVWEIAIHVSSGA